MKEKIREYYHIENTSVYESTFALARAAMESRSRNNYRGVKINDNVYSSLLKCGDCGSPMFATGGQSRKSAYTCGTHHRRGLKGCTTHHIRVSRQPLTRFVGDME